MKKLFMISVLVFFVYNVLPAQSIDKTKYKAIDPFDYEIEAANAQRRDVRKYVSVVQFWLQNGMDVYFRSLDGNTALNVKMSHRFPAMPFGQILAIYYTATKSQTIDYLFLDDIDPSITNEADIGLTKSDENALSDIDRSSYTVIDPFDYELEAFNTPQGEVRKYLSVVQYFLQSGMDISFRSLDGNTDLNLKAFRRFPAMTIGQRMVIFYTATKDQTADNLVLDEIDQSIRTEADIGLTKSRVNTSAGIDRSLYKAIDPFDYVIDSKNAQIDEPRKYKSTLQFSKQSGINYYFRSANNNAIMNLTVTKRFAPLRTGQRVTIYYTATKNSVTDNLILDAYE